MCICIAGAAPRFASVPCELESVHACNHQRSMNALYQTFRTSMCCNRGCHRQPRSLHPVRFKDQFGAISGLLFACYTAYQSLLIPAFNHSTQRPGSQLRPPFTSVHCNQYAEQHVRLALQPCEGFLRIMSGLSKPVAALFTCLLSTSSNPNCFVSTSTNMAGRMLMWLQSLKGRDGAISCTQTHSSQCIFTYLVCCMHPCDASVASRCALYATDMHEFRLVHTCFLNACRYDFHG